MPNPEQALPENWQFKNIILFDGVCNLCNTSIHFIIDRDPKAKFVFAPLQSSLGQQLVAQAGLPTTIDTIVFFKNGKVYTRSTAALEIAGMLTGFWFLLRVGYIIPRCIRDGVYNWIARHRYKWFGQTEACRIPTPALKSRFLA